MQRALQVLRNTNLALRCIGVAWFIANFAEWAYITALSIHEYRLHGALALGLIGARFVPGALAGSLLLGLVTRGRPPRALQLLSVLRCLTVAVAAVAVVARLPLAILIGVVWIDAMVAAPYRPAQASILPALSETPRELSAVAGSVPASKALAQAVGALAGSLALSVVGATVAVLGALGLFVVGAVLLAPVLALVDRSAVVGRAEPARGHSLAERFRVPRRPPALRLAAVRDGFELVAGRARPLLVLGGARSFTRGLWTSLAVVACLRLLGLGTSGVGLLLAAGGVGAALALPISVRLAGRRRLAGPAAFCFALSGLLISAVGVIAEPISAIALIAFWGLSLALADAISNSLIHRVVEARRLGPSVAAIESAKLMLEGLGALSAPGLLALFGIREAVIIAGAPLVVMILFSRGPLLRVDERAESRSRPLAALRRASSFVGLSMLALENIASRLEPVRFDAGEVIVRQGDQGDGFYLIDSGHVEVTVDGYAVSELGPQASFGEKAMLRGAQRSATVTALEPSSLWRLSGQDFIAGVTDNEGPTMSRLAGRGPSSLEQMLAAVPLFAGIDRRGLAERGTTLSIPDGRAIVAEGEFGERFYVLVDGEAQVSVEGTLIRTLVPGDHFGEIALLHSVPRTATVSAAGPVTVWVLDRDEFLKILEGASPAERSVPSSSPLVRGERPGEMGLEGAGLIV